MGQRTKVIRTERNQRTHCALAGYSPRVFMGDIFMDLPRYDAAPILDLGYHDQRTWGTSSCIGVPVRSCPLRKGLTKRRDLAQEAMVNVNIRHVVDYRGSAFRIGPLGNRSF